jgi:hypothetical protein
MNDLLKQSQELAAPVEGEPSEKQPGEEVYGDFAQRGTRMNERQSYERCVEGLKMASDGCRNLAVYFNRERWDAQADLFDKIRAGVVRLAGIGAPADATESKKKFGGDGLTRNASYDRVYRGLTMAAAGMLQIAGGHRGDLRWSKIAFMAYSLRDTAGELIRLKKRGPIIKLN